ncbi:hypothetical protein CIK95_06740 [Prevotella sp. P5-108]|uniref:DUF349 domain-containing protein n=1 Tax=Prevotella sp. P5-108 TaxID=2024225 RepID=UPI000B96B1C3|nr:DUF349 domain-containing protein [Prevotella sp. P5-108]OYP64713.1 hypothetical protein CIK95_06740 [Prevotella sp. P5-108]
MMDSQDNVLKQDITEEAVAAQPANVDNDTVAEAGNAPATTAVDSEPDTEAAPLKMYASKHEVLERVKELAHSDETPAKDEVDHLKTAFYKLLFAEREADQKTFIENGGDPEAYVMKTDDSEEQFKAEMGLIKEKRAKAFQQQEEEKKANLQRKQQIIEKIKMMSTSPEEANKSYNDFKALQQEWKDIKAVPAEKANELWRNYQLYVEQYYDLLNLNRELREYDFKKNLEQKTLLCEAAEKLADEPDAVSAFHQLQELHQQYREIGPVAKELREQIWARFKAASTVINKRHQQHFEELRAKEEENLTRKTALCEKVEAIAKEENKNATDWENHTKQIIDIQTEWKTIGFAPQKMNVKIFDRFRAACDDFFGRKAEFFKTLKEKFAENTKKKKEMVEQAKALMDSTDWKATSDKLIKLQKEWKTTGMVPKKVGDQLWAEFVAACNKFFEARNAATAGTRNEEQQNLDRKKEIIAKLKELLDSTADNVQATLQQLIDEYGKIGHVPFKEKDKLFKEYHKVVDALYKQLNISASKQRLDNFKSSIKSMAKQGEDMLDNERGRLMRRYEQLKSEITTYENNLGFLNASSKKGNSLIDEMNRKVNKLKDDLELIRQKIKAIDAENK